eukprot:scaffold62756_cov14-Tisochrysis_lutea.AAC.2
MKEPEDGRLWHTRRSFSLLPHVCMVFNSLNICVSYNLYNLKYNAKLYATPRQCTTLALFGHQIKRSYWSCSSKPCLACKKVVNNLREFLVRLVATRVWPLSIIKKWLKTPALPQTQYLLLQWSST